MNEHDDLYQDPDLHNVTFTAPAYAGPCRITRDLVGLGDGSKTSSGTVGNQRRT